MLSKPPVSPKGTTCSASSRHGTLLKSTRLWCILKVTTVSLTKLHPKFSTGMPILILLMHSQSSYHKALSRPSPFSSDATMPLSTHFSKLTWWSWKYEAILVHLFIQDKEHGHTFPIGFPEVHTYFPLSIHLGYISCPLLHCTWNKVVPDSAPKWFCLQ